MANTLNAVGASPLTSHGVLVGQGTTTAINSVAVGTTGQVLLANTGADPSWGSPLAPASSSAFMYVQNSDQNNVTGDGTDYTVIFSNQIFDYGSNFDGTSTFTAPTTGIYMFGYMMYLTGMTSAMTNNLMFLVTTGATYRFEQFNPYVIQGNGDSFCVYGSVLAPMTATNTATMHIRFLNGTKVLNIVGATNATFRTPVFWGYKVA